MSHARLADYTVVPIMALIMRNRMTVMIGADSYFKLP